MYKLSVLIYNYLERSADDDTTLKLLRQIVLEGQYWLRIKMDYHQCEI